MARLQAAKGRVGGLRRVVRALMRALLYLAVAGAVGVGLLALALRRDGFDADEVVLVVLLLAAPAALLLFVAGMRELVGLPERLLRLPQEGARHAEELTRLAGDARMVSWRRAPFLLWRLRGVVTSARGLVGVSLPLRLFTPPVLALTFAAAVACLVLALVGLVALLVLAVS